MCECITAAGKAPREPELGSSGLCGADRISQLFLLGGNHQGELLPAQTYLLPPASTSGTNLSCLSGGVLSVFFAVIGRFIDALGVWLETKGSARCLAGLSLWRGRCV